MAILGTNGVHNAYYVLVSDGSAC